MAISELSPKADRIRSGNRSIPSASTVPLWLRTGAGHHHDNPRRPRRLWGASPDDGGRVYATHAAFSLPIEVMPIRSPRLRMPEPWLRRFLAKSRASFGSGLDRHGSKREVVLLAAAKLRGFAVGMRLPDLMHRSSTNALPPQSADYAGSDSRADRPRVQRRPIREIGQILLTAVVVIGLAVVMCLLLGFRI